MVDSGPHQVQLSPRWSPTPGYVKLNFDSSAAGNPGMARVGDLVRNDKGVVLLSYSGTVGFCSINKAELLAFNIGLPEASRLNLQNLIMEGDSTYVIRWASNSPNYPWYLADLIEEVK